MILNGHRHHQADNTVRVTNCIFQRNGRWRGDLRSLASIGQSFRDYSLSPGLYKDDSGRNVGWYGWDHNTLGAVVVRFLWNGYTNQGGGRVSFDNCTFHVRQPLSRSIDLWVAHLAAPSVSCLAGMLTQCRLDRDSRLGRRTSVGAFGLARIRFQKDT